MSSKVKVSIRLSKTSQISNDISLNKTINKMERSYSINSIQNSDSGIEDETENLTEKIQPINIKRYSSSHHNLNRIDTQQITKEQASPYKSKKLGSLINLFKIGNKNKSYNLPKNIDYFDSSQGQTKLYDTCKGCPPSIVKQNEWKSRGKNSITSSSISSSRTSDLGESLPSTPASTISRSDIAEIPGLVGMHNLGNTCYFNSILQCLSHIDLVGEYFGRDHFKDDLSMSSMTNITSKQKSMSLPASMNSNKNQQNNGDLSFFLSLLIKSLWQSDLYSMNKCQVFHEVIGSYDKQYAGFEQQDAQEFFMWLIDKVHEESFKLPRKKKSKELKKKKNHTDAEQAVVAFASYTHYSQSYIQGLFLSQYRSSITCMYCKKQSNTFDPYTCISLSIPQPIKRAVFVSIIYSINSIVSNKYAFSLERENNVVELKDRIHSNILDLKKFLILEIQNNGNISIIKKSNLIGSLSTNEDSIYAVEISTDYFGPNNDQNGYENNFERMKDSITLVVSNVEVWGPEHRRFGRPLTLTVSKGMSFQQLQVIIRKKMSVEVRSVLIKTIKQCQMKLGLRCIKKGATGEKVFLNSDEKFPLRNDVLTKYFVNDEEGTGQFLYLVAEWEPLVQGWYMKYMGIPRPQEHQSCVEIRREYAKPHVVELEDCLKLQTQEEKLGADNTWKCQFCNKNQQGITKKLSLWSLPDILVLHLKRFDQLQGPNGKISTLVNYPITELNMSSHVATTTTQLQNKFIKKESLRLNYQPPPQTEAECMYDLKAVCNHIGPYINKGHYTSTCLNSTTNDWYVFDDRYVHLVNEADIVTPSAYLLFYQRKSLSTRVSDKIYNSISKATSSPADHWSYDISRSVINNNNTGLRFISKDDNELY